MPQPAQSRGPLAMLFASAFVNMLGTTLTVVAVPLITLGLGGGAGQLGVVGAAEAAAGATGIALSAPLFARFGARRVAVAACLGAALLVSVVPLLSAAGRLTVPAVAMTGAAAALVASPGVTARQEMLGRCASAAQLPRERADALYWLLVRGGAALGAPLASLLMTRLGTANLLWCDAGSFVVSALLLWSGPQAGSPALREPAVGEPTARTGYRRQLSGGLRALTATARLRTLTLVVLVLAAADGPRVSVLVPVYLRDGHAAATALGWMLGAYTAGSLAGLGAYAWIVGRVPTSVVLPGCLALTAAAYGALASSTGLPVGLAAMGIMGAAQGPFLPAMITTVYAQCTPGTAPTALGGLLALTSIAVPVGTLACAAALTVLPLACVFVLIAALFAVAGLPVRAVTTTAAAAGPGDEGPGSLLSAEDRRDRA